LNHRHVAGGRPHKEKDSSFADFGEARFGAGDLSDSNNGSWRNTTRREINGRAMRYNTSWHATREIRVKLGYRVDAAICRLSAGEARA
jgi:hypothetical protein